MESERIDEASAREVGSETWWYGGGGGEAAEVAKGHGFVRGVPWLVWSMGLVCATASMFVT